MSVRVTQVAPADAGVCSLVVRTSSSGSGVKRYNAYVRSRLLSDLTPDPLPVRSSVSQLGACRPRPSLVFAKLHQGATSRHSTPAQARACPLLRRRRCSRPWRYQSPPASSYCAGAAHAAGRSRSPRPRRSSRRSCRRRRLRQSTSPARHPVCLWRTASRASGWTLGARCSSSSTSSSTARTTPSSPRSRSSISSRPGRARSGHREISTWRRQRRRSMRRAAESTTVRLSLCSRRHALRRDARVAAYSTHRSPCTCLRSAERSILRTSPRPASSMRWRFCGSIV